MSEELKVYNLKVEVVMTSRDALEHMWREIIRIALTLVDQRELKSLNMRWERGDIE